MASIKNSENGQIKDFDSEDDAVAHVKSTLCADCADQVGDSNDMNDVFGTGCGSRWTADFAMPGTDSGVGGTIKPEVVRGFGSSPTAGLTTSV